MCSRRGRAARVGDASAGAGGTLAFVGRLGVLTLLLVLSSCDEGEAATDASVIDASTDAAAADASAPRDAGADAAGPDGSAPDGRPGDASASDDGGIGDATLTLGVAVTATTAGDDHDASGDDCPFPRLVSGPDLVFHFVAPAAATYRVQVDPVTADYDVLLYVRTDCEASACLKGVNLNGAGDPESVTLPLAAGEGVLIFVDTDFTSTGSSHRRHLPDHGHGRLIAGASSASKGEQRPALRAA